MSPEPQVKPVTTRRKQTWMLEVLLGKMTEVLWHGTSWQPVESDSELRDVSRILVLPFRKNSSVSQSIPTSQSEKKMTSPKRMTFQTSSNQTTLQVKKKTSTDLNCPFSASGWPLRSCEVDEAIASLRCRLDRFHRAERKDEGT